MNKKTGLLLPALACAAAQAQTYPSKPVRLVTGSAAGGGVDRTARDRTAAHGLPLAGMMNPRSAVQDEERNQ